MDYLKLKDLVFAEFLNKFMTFQILPLEVSFFVLRRQTFSVFTTGGFHFGTSFHDISWRKRDVNQSILTV